MLDNVASHLEIVVGAEFGGNSIVAVSGRTEQDAGTVCLSVSISAPFHHLRG